MRNAKIFIRNVFSLNQQDFWLIISFNLAISGALRLLDIHVFIETILILLMFWKSFNFLKEASVMPAISSDFDRFSWKYFQGLPLSKKELVISLVITNFLAISPLIVWVLSFNVQIGSVFVDDDSMRLETKLKLVSVCLLAIIYFGFSTLKNLLKLPRKQYSRVDQKTLAYESVALLLLLSVLITYGSVLIVGLEEALNLNLGYYIGFLIKEAFAIVISWWIVPLLGLLTVLQYHSTLKVWQDEKIGYLRSRLGIKPSLGIIAFCCLLQVHFFKNIDVFTPEIYAESQLLRHIYKSDMKKVYETLEKTDYKKPNLYGVTPIMAAAKEGHYNLVKFLKDSGADLKGQIHFKEDPFLNGMGLLHLAVLGKHPQMVKYLLKEGLKPNEKNPSNGYAPLHIAAKNCQTEMIDILIENKALINEVNNKGDTPLHIAAKRRCYGAVVSLMEAGANPMVKNKEGKLALELAEHAKYGNIEVAYYIKKRSRQPAGSR